MKNFQTGRRFRGVMASRVVQGFLLLSLVLVASRAAVLYQNERVGASEVMSLERELEELVAHRAELSAEIASLGTERGVEEEIRERFGVVKEGEKVINLVGEVATITAPIAPDSWWQAVWIKIFGV